MEKKQKIGELDCTIVTASENDSPEAVVILCHGFGATASDLVPLGREFINADPAFSKTAFFFPGAPLELDPVYEARAWWMIDIEKIQQLQALGEFREMSNSSPDELPACREMINEVIEFAKTEHQLPASKIIIGGFSQGSMLSTDVALHYPEPLGGLIIWSGALINQDVWKAQAARESKLKIVQTHGSIDPILPIAGAKLLAEMLNENQHSVFYREFMGPHTIPPEGIQMAGELLSEVIAAD